MTWIYNGMRLDQSFARTHKERNMMIDPLTQKEYHPGVCLAVHEFFGQRVSAQNGFWMMRKVNDSWQHIQHEEIANPIPSL